MLSTSTCSLTSLRDTQGEGRLRTAPEPIRSVESHQRSRMGALQAWAHIVAALTASDLPNDREPTERITSFIRESASRWSTAESGSASPRIRVGATLSWLR